MLRPSWLHLDFCIKNWACIPGTLLDVRSGGRGLGNLFTAVVNHAAPSRRRGCDMIRHSREQVSKFAATWLYNEFIILQSFTISKRVKRIFPVIIISQIEYADKIKIPVWVPQFNENWRHLKLTSLKRAVWCINVQSGDRSTPPFWMLCCTCSDVYGAFKRETCFTWFLPGFFDIYVPGKLTNQITRNFFAV